MIQKIRRRFIQIAVVVLAVAMALVAGVINLANWVNVRQELSETLQALCQDSERSMERNMGGKGPRSRSLSNRVNEARYFSVYIEEDGALRIMNRARALEYTASELEAIAEGALAAGDSGFFGDYLYQVEARGDGSRIAVFLNCETRLNATRNLALISAAAWMGGLLLAWLLVARFSGRAIRPMVENAIQQKQFITDAGHELKTPLTVISANMDVLALETGENEWIRSTQKQVSGMRGLVNELIYLSRLDEEDSRLNRTTLDAGQLLTEAAEPFIGMAEFSDKTVHLEVSGNCRIQGDEAAIRRLFSVLCDNAVKYAPEGDAIEILLTGDARRVTLQVENGLKALLEAEALRHLFDRFYRADASRSRQTGGYGLGLSIARAIVEKHSGDIEVCQTEEGRLRFTVVLPSA